jgi:hypothetical protein
VDAKIWTVVKDTNGKPHGRGHSAIILLTLSFCEAMAGLVNGKTRGGTELTVKFLENEVGKQAGRLAKRYEERAAALFVLYRHRLAHQREPGLLQIGSDVLWWSMMRGDDEDPHLRFDHEKTDGHYTLG